MLLGDDQDRRPAKPKYKHFWFGTRRVSATATPIDRVHSNVFRLRLCPGLGERLVLLLICLLPQALRVWAAACWPEWFLPSTVILKKRKENWDEEFYNEQRMYAKLRVLQGEVIPVLYGRVRCDGVPALLLSDIGGVALYHVEAAGIPPHRLSSLMGDALGALARLGFVHDDTKLANYHLIGSRTSGKIMVVDLESVEETGLENAMATMPGDIKFLLRNYAMHQEALQEDGLWVEDIT